jgi:predicted phage-related endonuclease
VRLWLRPGDDGYILPGSPQHHAVVSPSKVAAILGLSRWESAFSLWCRLKGWTAAEEPKDAFAVGHAWEPSMREFWKLDGRNQGWLLGGAQHQVHTDAFGFPACATLDGRAVRGRARRVVEFKVTQSLDAWGDPNADEAPSDYAAQVIAAMALTGYTAYPAHLMVLGPRINQRTIYEIPFDDELAGWMFGVCADFWSSLAQDNPPALDNSLATYETVRELHPDIDGSEVQVPRDLVLRLRDARYEADRWATELRGHKTQLLDLMKQAQYAKVGDTQVASRYDNGKGGIALTVNKKPI